MKRIKALLDAPPEPKPYLAASGHRMIPVEVAYIDVDGAPVWRQHNAVHHISCPCDGTEPMLDW